MRVAYLLGAWPALSESFIRREVEGLRGLGVEVFVMALDHQGKKDRNAVYYPGFFSWKALRGFLDGIVWRPALLLGGYRLFGSGKGFRGWLRYMRRLSMAFYFMRVLKRQGFGHVHAQFASLPADLARIMRVLAGFSFSISAHARDIYVEGGDLAGKIRAARFVVTCTALNRAYLQGLVSDQEAEKIFYIPHGLDSARWPFVRRKGEQSAEGKDALRVTSNGNGGPHVGNGGLHVGNGSPGVGQQPGGAGGKQAVPELLFVGRLIPKKGLSILLEAVAGLKEQGLVCRCRIIGAGPLRGSLEQVAKQLGIREQVWFEGAQPPDRVRSVMQAASLFIFPGVVASDGDRDGLPNVLLEAASSGLPIVASDVSAVGELVAHKKSGWLVSSGNKEALMEGILAMLSNPHRMRMMALTARKKVERHYDLYKNVERLEKILRFYLEERG